MSSSAKAMAEISPVHAALVRSLYRSVCKQIVRVHDHYQRDFTKTSRSLFGAGVSPEYWKCFGTSPLHAVRHYFRNGWPVSLPPRTRPLAVFELLKRLEVAMSDPEKDTQHVQNLPLYRGRFTFKVHCYFEERPPPPRLTVNGDLFWNTQMCLPNQSFPWREAFTQWVMPPAQDDSTNPPLCSDTLPHVDGDDTHLLNALSTVTTTVTHRISVTCSTRLVVQSTTRSSPQNVFEYTITIKNMHDSGDPESAVAIQLLSRHWYFLDWQRSTVAEVWGKGVAGQYPILLPGEEHTYSSGTDLLSGSGVMRGCFQFARFSLTRAAVAARVHHLKNSGEDTLDSEANKPADEVMGVDGEESSGKEGAETAPSLEKGEADERQAAQVQDRHLEKNASSCVKNMIDMVDAFIQPTLLSYHTSTTMETKAERSNVLKKDFEE